MSTRKSPPPPINSTAAEKGKGRARPPSRTPSRADHNSDDDAPPTSTLRARNVTGTSMLEFPPSPGTPRSEASDKTAREGARGGMVGAGWKLPGVKGTMGGLASPGRQGPGPPAAWSPHRPAEKDGENTPQRPPVTFRTDPTIKSCLDTLPLESKDEIRRLFGLS